MQNKLTFFLKQNKGCRGISICNTLKYINRKNKYKREGGHKPKPLRIKEKEKKQRKRKKEQSKIYETTRIKRSNIKAKY